MAEGERAAVAGGLDNRGNGPDSFIASGPARQKMRVSSMFDQRHRTFSVACGLDENELQISTIDANGIALAATKTLCEERTIRLEAENAELHTMTYETERQLQAFHECQPVHGPVFRLCLTSSTRKPIALLP